MRTTRTGSGWSRFGAAATTTLLAACGGAPAKSPPSAAAPPAASASAANGPVVKTAQLGTPSDFRTRIFNQDTYPAHPATFPHGVTGLADVTYATLPGFRPLKLDLYLPPGDPKQGSHPFVIFLHGGGWGGGNPRVQGAVTNWPEVLAAVASRGYVVASVSYRLVGEAPFPAAVQDAKAAIRFLRAHATDYGVDKQRGIAWGGSAGAQIAGLVATSCGVAALEPPTPPGQPAESTCVQGAVGWFGVYDLTTYKAPSVGPYLRCTTPGCTPEENAKLASAITHVDEKDPPVFLVHGDGDKLAPVEQAKAFHAALVAKHVRSELVIEPGVDHAFIGPTAEVTQHANVDAFDRTMAFIDSVVADRSAAPTNGGTTRP